MTFKIFIIHYALLVDKKTSLPVQTVSVVLMYPLLLFYTQHLLQFEQISSERNGWSLSTCKTCYRKNIFDRSYFSLVCSTSETCSTFQCT